MEAFQIPVSVLLTLTTGLFTLAVSIYNPQLFIEPHVAEKKYDPVLTTQCERLVGRYLLMEKASFSDLTGKIEKFLGSGKYEMMLKVADSFVYDKKYQPDRIYQLRGDILARMGRSPEAADNYLASLRWNRDNIRSRSGLINHYIHAESFDLARLEISKALEHETSDERIALLLSMLNEVETSVPVAAGI